MTEGGWEGGRERWRVRDREKNLTGNECLQGKSFMRMYLWQEKAKHRTLVSDSVSIE